MKKLRTVALLALVALFLSALAACAARSESFKSTTDYDLFQKGYEVIPDETAAEGSNYYSTPDAEQDNSDGTSFERKIIKTVNIAAETKNFDNAINLIETSTNHEGGYIEKSGITGRSYANGSYYTRRATYRIRIPAVNLDAFLAKLGDAINIVDNQSMVDDVSSKYYDIVSRLETLEAERTALTNMYASAETVEYMLQIQKRLYDVIEEIESYKTTLKYYDNQVAYSTVNLLIEEVIEYTEKVPEPTTFGERISRAFKESWKNFTNGCQDFAVWLVYALPTLLVLAVLGGCIALIVYLSLRNSIKRKKSGRGGDEERK
jgi:hypothetical protein